MSKKKGRPKKIDRRTIVRKTRMTNEENYHFLKICEKEGYSVSKGLRMAVKALEYLSKNDMIYCVTENEEIDSMNYCATENDTDGDNDVW